LKRRKQITDGEIAEIESHARALVDRAAEFALSSPFPSPQELATQVTL
jgi:TPP-dependent pyruvate/acetoin dehydrogenase alpha subunit